jgi:RNA polymerase sigma factor (sigma-70 family)
MQPAYQSAVPFKRMKVMRPETTKAAASGQSPTSSPRSSAAAFKFQFNGKLSPRSIAGKIVARLEKGEISSHKANTLLMERFSRRRDAGAFSALYEINYKLFLHIIRKKLGGIMHLLSPADVLQDVFLMIYRYPDKFRCESDYSFRNWSYSIILNTIRKRINKIRFRTVNIDTVPEAPAEEKYQGPLDRLIVSEETLRFRKLYSILLILYMNAFRARLNSREMDALHMVEVEQISYKEAAPRLGVKYENFKMLVCRARKKIAQGIADLVEQASEWSCLPEVDDSRAAS